MRSLLHQLDVAIAEASCLDGDKEVLGVQIQRKDSTDEERRRLGAADHG